MIAPLSPEDAVPESAPVTESSPVSVYCCVCGAPVPEDDNFCEECGASLKAKTDPSELPCPKCGAGAGQIDAEGFCSSCGIRREQRGRDRLELAVSAELAGISDRGRRHHRNEDFFAVQAFGEPRGFVMVVCDGVSSARDPDQASEAACVVACSSLAAAFEAGDVADSDMIAALQAGQRAVESIPGGGPESEQPATTIVAAAVRGNVVSIAWLGDSRAYWIGAEGVQRLTQDHSWLADAGTSTDETPEPEFAHAITRWLGAGAEGFEPGLAHFEISGQGLLLLCSDGLWNYASDATIEKLAAESAAESRRPALSICRDLVAFALDQGGNDNVTALVVSVAPVEESQGPAEAPGAPPATGMEPNDSVQS